MKLAKLSLAAIVVAGLATSSFAADTLEGAFKEGKVSGAVQAYYWDRDTGTASTSGKIFSTGLDLSYQTGTLNGFAMKATFQSSASPFVNQEGKSAFAGEMWASGAGLSEIYLSYTMKNTTALVGRMYLDTPLVASSGSRMNKTAFEGVAVINTDLPNTTLIAGYVQKYQTRGTASGNFGTFENNAGNLAGEGAYTIAAINKSIKGLTLTGAYADVIDAIQAGYLEAAYEGTASSFTYGLAAQYYYNNPDAAGADNSHLYGVKATVGVGAVTGYAAYTSVSKDNAIVSGLGGADLAYTASPINSSSYTQDTKAYKIGATYAVLANANLGLNYTVTDDKSADLKKSYTAFEADYAFDGALKGLGIAFIYEDMGKDADGDEMWVNLNYKF